MNPGFIHGAFFGSGNQLQAPMQPNFFNSQPQIPVVPYKTTVTPFGPILPTAFTLSPPDVITSQPRAISSFVVGPPPKVEQPPRVDPIEEQRRAAEEVIRRILTRESSSSEGESERPKSSPLESRSGSHRHSRVGEFKQQETAVHSPVLAPVGKDAPVLSPPTRLGGSSRTPRPDRLRKKQEDLDRVQQFLEESRAVHEKIYASFDVRRLSTRGAGPNAATSSSNKRRSLSQVVTDANNVAELRRNIAQSAGNKREVSPLPPRAPSAQRTPSASSRSPRPVSPDRIVSGVFVSYPRKAKRSISAPPADNAAPEPSMETNLISSSRPQGSAKTAKMSAEEYAQLRRNLLTRSEQHAVTSTGSSLA